MGKQQNFNNFSIKINNVTYNQEDLDNLAWKRSVLDGHIQTAQESRKLLVESRSWRKRLENSWDKIKAVTDTWINYEEQFKNAIHNLSVRVEEFEKEQEDIKRKEEEARQKEEESSQRVEDELSEETFKLKEESITLERDHFAKCTKLSMIRRRKKHVSDKAIHTFRV